MRIPRIFTEQDLSENSQILLEEAPSHHIIKVLRMKAGRELVLFNGNGLEYKASITEAGKKQATVQVHLSDNPNTESPLHTHLAIGLSRGERFDFVLQKATELGVHAITPLITERTEVKLNGDRLDKKMASWRKIMVGASEQSGRTVVPTLCDVYSLDQFIQEPFDGEKWVLHHRNTSRLQSENHSNKNTNNTIKSLRFMVGPEGGLSEDEIIRANKIGYKNLSLGPRVLRTETAPLAALTLFQAHWGDI